MVFIKTSFSLKSRLSLVLCHLYTSFCLIGFLLRFLELISSFSLLRWNFLFSMVLVSCVQLVLLTLSDVAFSCTFRNSWKTLLISGCQKHYFSSLYSSYLCPFFSIDNCWRWMLLTNHVICLNHYHCRNPPLSRNILLVINDEASWYHRHCKLRSNYVIWQKASTVRWIKYFPYSRLNLTSYIFLEGILLEPSCSFEDNVTTSWNWEFCILIRCNGI